MEKQHEIIIKGLMNGDIHHSIPFETLIKGNRSYTWQHNFGRRVGIALDLLIGYGAIFGIFYGIGKTNINEKLFKGIFIAVLVLFAGWTTLTVMLGRSREYPINQERKPSFTNGCIDGMIQTILC